MSLAQAVGDLMGPEFGGLSHTFLIKDRSETHVIYYLRSGDYVKIGTCRRGRLASRISELQMGNPEPLVLLGIQNADPRDEEWEHMRFQRDRYRGEWFRLTPYLKEWIVGATYPHPDLERLLADVG